MTTCIVALLQSFEETTFLSNKKKEEEEEEEETDNDNVYAVRCSRAWSQIPSFDAARESGQPTLTASSTRRALQSPGSGARIYAVLVAYQRGTR